MHGCGMACLFEVLTLGPCCTLLKSTEIFETERPHAWHVRTDTMKPELTALSLLDHPIYEGLEITMTSFSNLGPSVVIRHLPLQAIIFVILLGYPSVRMLLCNSYPVVRCHLLPDFVEPDCIYHAC